MATTIDMEILEPSEQLSNSTQTPHLQLEHHESPVGLLVLKGICVTAITLTNIFANSLCLVVLRRVRELNPVTKAFMFNMTISDLCTGVLVCGPIIGSIIHDSWPYGQLVCTASGIANIVFSFTSFMSLLNVNLERYLAVTRPFDYPHLVTLPRAYATIFLLWIVSGSMGTLNAVLPGRIASYSPGLHTCTVGPEDTSKMDIIGSVLMCLFIIVPFTITLTLFVRLFVLARFHANRIAALSRSMGTENKTERKSFTTFFIMTMCLTVCYTPLVISFGYENITRKELPLPFVYVAELLTFSNSVSNVMIYYARNTTFRQTAQRVLRGVLPEALITRRNHEDDLPSHSGLSFVSEMTVATSANTKS
ncbi:histamine H2 receptor-like [Amphiura filiformis]|uniref:histamine H2 receptor-like n=1 Tax=Amphiura filiformis TaxID=82378 RepID=UPI003B21932E